MGFSEVGVSQIAYEPEKVRGYCRSCPNYGRVGSCPPMAPRLEEIVDQGESGLLIYARFVDEMHAGGEGKTVPGWWLQDRVLTGFMTRLGRALSIETGGCYLGPGRCRACRPCSFSVGGDVCRKPDRRAYSITAAGVLAQQTVKEVFGLDLKWGTKKGEPVIIIKLMAVFAGHREEGPERFNEAIKRLLDGGLKGSLGIIRSFNDRVFG